MHDAFQCAHDSDMMRTDRFVHNDEIFARMNQFVSNVDELLRTKEDKRVDDEQIVSLVVSIVIQIKIRYEFVKKFFRFFFANMHASKNAKQQFFQIFFYC